MDDIAESVALIDDVDEAFVRAGGLGRFSTRSMCLDLLALLPDEAVATVGRLKFFAQEWVATGRRTAELIEAYDALLKKRRSSANVGTLSCAQVAEELVYGALTEWEFDGPTLSNTIWSLLDCGVSLGKIRQTLASYLAMK